MMSEGSKSNYQGLRDHQSESEIIGFIKKVAFSLSLFLKVKVLAKTKRFGDSNAFFEEEAMTCPVYVLCSGQKLFTYLQTEECHCHTALKTGSRGY